MKKEIFYATTNCGKFEQVKEFLEKNEPSIILKQFKADIPEIQTFDQKLIAIDKAIKAWELLQKPLFVDDAAIYFEKFNHFPGTLSKYVSQGIGFEGISRLIDEGDKAYFLLYLTYVDGIDSVHTFEGRCNGRLTKPQKFVGHPELPYECFFIPEGTNKTFWDLHGAPEEEEYRYRIKAVKSFLNWYKKK